VRFQGISRAVYDREEYGHTFREKHQDPDKFRKRLRRRYKEVLEDFGMEEEETLDPEEEEMSLVDLAKTISVDMLRGGKMHENLDEPGPNSDEDDEDDEKNSESGSDSDYDSDDEKKKKNKEHSDAEEETGGLGL
jgi:hypothetical protein